MIQKIESNLQPLVEDWGLSFVIVDITHIYFFLELNESDNAIYASLILRSELCSSIPVLLLSFRNDIYIAPSGVQKERIQVM